MTRYENDALLKVTLNLYKDDVAEMEQVFGHGWSVHLRDLLHKYLTRRRESMEAMENTIWKTIP